MIRRVLHLAPLLPLHAIVAKSAAVANRVAVVTCAAARRRHASRAKRVLVGRIAPVALLAPASK